GIDVAPIGEMHPKVYFTVREARRLCGPQPSDCGLRADCRLQGLAEYITGNDMRCRLAILEPVVVGEKNGADCRFEWAVRELDFENFLSLVLDLGPYPEHIQHSPRPSGDCDATWVPLSSQRGSPLDYGDRK